MAGKMIGQQTVYATYTMGERRLGGGTKRQLFGNFLAFSESSHQLGPEKPCGARKSLKVAKWVTLEYSAQRAGVAYQKRP